jgi:glucose-1-phosphate thymidylyltransferase
MKALVLSGGLGTRLRPFSHTMAKQVIPVANRPVLLHCLEAIRDAGITDVGIIVGSRAADIRHVVGTGAQLGLRVTYIRQEAPLGLAHCVLIARDFLGDDDFVMYLGDNVIPSGIGELISDFAGQPTDAMLLVAKVDNPVEFGVAETAPDGRVRRVVEKSSAPASDLAVIGVYVFSRAIHQAVRSIKPSWRNEREITDAIQWLIEHDGDVRAHQHLGYWKDTGQIGDLLDCNRVLLEELEPAVDGDVDSASTIVGPVLLDPSAQVSQSRLVGPLVIGPDTVISGSYVGPYTSIGAGCLLDSAALEGSIVMDGAIVRDIRHIRDSVIGRGARVGRTAATCDGHRLIVGDHGQLQICT